MILRPGHYIGMDIATGVCPVILAVLDSKMKLLALHQVEMDKAIAEIEAYDSAIIAINAPPRPNQGVMLQPEVRQHFGLPRKTGRWANLRLAEYDLIHQGINLPRTAAQAEDCPPWMRTAFDLYKRLQNKGARAYPMPEASHQWLETNCDIFFRSLLGHPAYPARSLEGRLQRQVTLFDKGLYISDPMECFEEITRHKLMHGNPPFKGIYQPSELDALAAAYLAWMVENRPQSILRIGAPDEGVIYFPTLDGFEPLSTGIGLLQPRLPMG